MSSSTHPSGHPVDPSGGAVDGVGGRPELVMAVMGASHRLGGSERGTIETAAADVAAADAARGLGRRWLIVLRDTGPGEAARLCAELGVELVLVDSTRDVHRLVRTRRPTILYVFGPRWSVPLRLALGPSRVAARLALGPSRVAARLVRLVRRGRPGRTDRRTGDIRGARTERLRFVVAQRGLDVWRKPWHRWADRFTHWLVDRYIANSQAAADMLVHQVGIPQAKVSVLRTGLGDPWFAPPAEPRERPGQPPHIVIVGNDRPEKALDDAVAALGAIADLDWRATIYTDVAERLAGVIGAAGLGERICLVTGHRVSPVDLDAADLLLQTSVAESLPRAVLEAVARGVRVLASDVGDTATIVPADQVFPAADRVTAAALLRTWLGRPPAGVGGQPAGIGGRPAGLGVLPADDGASRADDGASRADDGASRATVPAAASPWQQPQPVTVAHELDVADALCRLAHEPVRTHEPVR